jgi:hypothetical protein
LVVYPVNHERCRTEEGSRMHRLQMPFGLPEHVVPLERLIYRPTGATKDREVELLYLGANDLRTDYWTALRKHVADGGVGVDGMMVAVACDTWLRVHFGVVSRHFFKTVDWKGFFHHLVGPGSATATSLGTIAISKLIETGRRRCRSGLPSMDDLLVRLHFAEDRLGVADPERAGRFLEENASEIVEIERKLLVERDVTERLERASTTKRTQGGSGGGRTPAGVGAVKIDNLLRSRFRPLREKAEREGLDIEAVHLEALVRTIESTNPFYELMLSRVRDDLSPEAQRLFRLFHIAGPRRGGAIPVPVIWSDTLRSILLFIVGDQEGKWSLDEFVLAPDLLAVLGGGDPLAPPLDRAVYASIGLVEHVRSWTFLKREHQRESRPKKSDLSLRDSDPDDW